MAAVCRCRALPTALHAASATRASASATAGSTAQCASERDCVQPIVPAGDCASMARASATQATVVQGVPRRLAAQPRATRPVRDEVDVIWVGVCATAGTAATSARRLSIAPHVVLSMECASRASACALPALLGSIVASNCHVQTLAPRWAVAPPGCACACRVVTAPIVAEWGSIGRRGAPAIAQLPTHTVLATSRCNGAAATRAGPAQAAPARTRALMAAPDTGAATSSIGRAYAMTAMRG